MKEFTWGAWFTLTAAALFYLIGVRKDVNHLQASIDAIPSKFPRSVTNVVIRSVIYPKEGTNYYGLQVWAAGAEAYSSLRAVESETKIEAAATNRLNSARDYGTPTLIPTPDDPDKAMRIPIRDAIRLNPAKLDLATMFTIDPAGNVVTAPDGIYGVFHGHAVITNRLPSAEAIH